jgi:hypothetical protein
MAPIGHAQPQKSLFPIILNNEMEAKIVMKIMGTDQPAFRNRKGFVIEETGLGCIPIPHANLPKGNAGSIPKTKNTIANEIIRKLRCTHDFIRNPNPIAQQIAAIQTRGNNKISKNPRGLLPPPPSAQTMLVIKNNITVTPNTIPNILYIWNVLRFIFLPAPLFNSQKNTPLHLKYTLKKRENAKIEDL